MQLLDAVYDNYPATLARGGKVPGANVSEDLRTIRAGLPEYLKGLVATTGRDLGHYRVYGSAGQTNFNFARIPWVAVCDKRVTKSVERGYYIVLLFHEAMQGCFLSLNQGVTQFKRAFGTDDLVSAQIEASAARCLQLLDVEDGFIQGRIDLAATGAMGKGYERGAIASRWYARTEDISHGTFAGDLAYLLELYDRLIRRVGGDLTLQLPPISESAYQSAAASLARSVCELQEPSPGPAPPPPRVGGGGYNRFRRDPNVAALAQQRAGFKCEVDIEHRTFASKRSKQEFVESHHLVPMSLQPKFEVSLDVVENIIALCPTCHRLLHHGTAQRTRPIVAELFRRRRDQLAGRGIEIEAEQLLKIYATQLDADD